MPTGILDGNRLDAGQVVLLLSVSAASNPVVVRGLQQAQSLLQQGHHAQVADVCSRLLAQWPTLVEAMQLLALARKGQGEIGEAERLLRSCVQLQPQRAELHANLANLLRASGRVADAEASYRQALRADARFRPARLGLIRTLNAAGAYPEAQSEAAALVTADASDADAWAELGVAFKGQNKLSEAEAAYRAALARRPSFAIARHNLGSLLSQLERAEEALREIDRAAEAGVKGHAVHLNRAIVLQQLGRFEAAEQEFARAVQLAPTHVDTQARLAKLRFMRGDPDFTRSLRAVIAADLRNSQLQLCQASLLRDAGRLPEATAAFREAIVHCGERPELLMGLALTAMDAGIPDQALAPAQAAVCAQPDYLHVSTCLQSILLSLGRADEAMPLILRARAAAPLHQEHIACEATAARMLGLPRYHELYDYDRFVAPMQLERPDGFASIEAFCDELIGVLAQRQQLALHPLDQSLRFGAQTPRSLLADPHPLIRQFLGLLAAPIAEYRSRLPASTTHPLLSRNHGEAQLSGCWSIRLHRGGYHLNHVHPSGWLSSACYIHAPADTQDTVARSGWIKFGEPRYATPGLGPERMVQPRAGMLILFPSYLWHGTMPIATDEPRVTIGADILPGAAA